MTKNLFIGSGNVAGVWKWDSATSTYYLEISGTKVAQIDSSGTLTIKGDIITNENL